MIAKAIRGWVKEPTVTPAMIKVFVVSVAAAAVVIPLGLIAMPYIPIFNDMAVQPKGKAQMTWGSGEHRRPVERAPVDGTIPRGYFPYPLGSATPEQAGSVLRPDNGQIAPIFQPPKPTHQMLADGKELFERYCVVCHGAQARGDGVVTTKGFPAPPSLVTEAAREYPAGRIFHVITAGQGQMKPYADKLTPEQRWAVVSYVRALQRAYGPPPKEGGKK